MADTDEDKTCFDCNSFFPASSGATEFGICLNDGEFEPFLDELHGNMNWACCQDLIRRKRSDGNREPCADFDEAPESIEIDDDSALARELRACAGEGRLDTTRLQQAILEDALQRHAQDPAPVARHAEQLRSGVAKERESAASSLGALAALGSEEAFAVLLDFLQELPPPATVDEVHFRIELLRHLDSPERRSDLVPLLIEELDRTPSNNTTRQWITRVLQCLSECPRDQIADPIEALLDRKKFSYRLRRKIEALL